MFSFEADVPSARFHVLSNAELSVRNWRLPSSYTHTANKHTGSVLFVRTACGINAPNLFVSENYSLTRSACVLECSVGSVFQTLPTALFHYLLIEVPVRFSLRFISTYRERCSGALVPRSVIFPTSSSAQSVQQMSFSIHPHTTAQARPSLCCI